jgi:lysozyme
VSLEDAQLDLAKEWASLPMASGRGFYDGDSAGNKASATVQEVQRALKQARSSLAGRTLPQLRLPAQQNARPVKLPAHLRLTRTGKTDSRGLELLRLEEVVDGIPMTELLVVSGAPGRQKFKKGRDSKSGSLEPLPEGRWGVENIQWKAGRDNYNASWGPGLASG